MSEGKSYGRRDGDRRNGNSRGSGDRWGNRRGGRDNDRRDRSHGRARDEQGRGSRRQDWSNDRRDDRDRDRRDDSRGGYRGNRSGGDDRWNNRRDDRGGQRRDNRRGRNWEDRDDNRRSDDRRGDRRDGHRDDRRGGYQGDRKGRRDDRRDERRGGYRDDRRNERNGGGRGKRDDRRFDRREEEKDQKKGYSPQRSGFREERLNRRMADPDIPSDIDVNDLDPMVLQDLRVLSKENADAVAKHMIMAATWMEDDPQLALRHARAAKDRAGRVSVAREVNGIAAYRAGEWKEALAELRAARRMNGGPGMLAVMADCERGLGRPEKAIELGRSEEARQLDPETAIELAIVVAGARLDLNQADSAVVTLQRANPDKSQRGISATRLAYAYANALGEAGRVDESKEWFAHAAEIDEEEWTDAAERVAELEAQ